MTYSAAYIQLWIILCGIKYILGLKLLLSPHYPLSKQNSAKTAHVHELCLVTGKVHDVLSCRSVCSLYFAIQTILMPSPDRSEHGPAGMTAGFIKTSFDSLIITLHKHDTSPIWYMAVMEVVSMENKDWAPGQDPWTGSEIPCGSMGPVHEAMCPVHGSVFPVHEPSPLVQFIGGPLGPVLCLL